MIELTPTYLKKIQQLTIQLKKAAYGSQSGIHRSVRKGHGLEFSDLRPYSPGDDFRAVDWNALARTDKIYTRLYREDQDLKVLVVHDYSKSLSSYSLPKLISLTLCYIALCSADKVSLLLPEVTQFPWVNSPSNFKGMIDIFRTAEPSKELNLGLSIIKATNNLKVPARLFIVSDFLYPIEQVQQALEYATSKNFEASLILIDTFDENIFMNDGLYVDSENEKELNVEVNPQDLRLALESHYSKIFDLVRHYGQQSIILRHDELIEDVFFKKFINSNLLR